MKKHRTLTRAWLAAALSGVAMAAAAHDTWFEPLALGRTGDVRLALGTGNLFPTQEFSIDARYLVRQGCHSATGRVGALRALGNTATALHLQAPLAARVCWAQLQPFELSLEPDKIAPYLDEINASAGLRATWAALQARGLPWQETYTKHARINLGGVTAQSAVPSGMVMDMLMQAPAGPVRAGDTLVVQVLRGGQPLAGFPVELRSNLGPLGSWHQTDAQGRVAVQPSLAGRWVLRGTDLALSTSRPDEWESRFVTLAFEVAPAAAAAAEPPPGRPSANATRRPPPG